MTESSADAYVQDTFEALHPKLVKIYLGLTSSCLYHPFTSLYVAFGALVAG